MERLDSMKTVCIYHNNCFDGICSAWVVNTIYPDAEFIPANYNDSKLITNLTQDCYENANINDKLIIVDFSLPRDLMKLLANKVSSIIVLDHHKTAMAACEGLDFCKFDLNESGASLAWKHFHPGIIVPNLVRYIKDRDLWLFNEADSEAVNSYIQSFPMTIESYESLYQHLEDHRGIIDAKLGGESILRYKNTMVQAMCKNALITTDYWPITGVPVVNASMLFSEVGHELCKQFPNKPFAAYYFDRVADGKRQWGLRSIGDFDVSEVAKKFGGGGHKNAAGFEQDLSSL